MFLFRRLAFFAALLIAPWASAQKITINYATRTGTTWPLYIAKEAGYFQKYGLDVDIAFAVHPAGIAMVISGEAAMTNYPLEQAMLAGSKGGSLVIVGSPYRKSLFALMAGQKHRQRPRPQGQNDRREPDRRRALQLRGRPAREIRAHAAGRAMGSHRHRRERTRRGPGGRPRRRHHDHRARLFQARGKGIQEPRQHQRLRRHLRSHRLLYSGRPPSRPIRSFRNC